ncbi:MAG: NAD(P)/FAD-dependent oxidoreductase [Candidatus Sumerlaeota bacterium]|nr:NAD(P)/FAD-dependent oxidoreductase [Candidatus Sumerlaeota bacterium]
MRPSTSVYLKTGMKPLLRRRDRTLNNSQHGSEMWDAIVCGAGAAGLVSAGRAGERGLRILILEKTDIAGSKIRISGNGRCNLSNAAPLHDFIEAFGQNGHFLYSVFHRFFRDELLGLLGRLGVRAKTEPDGRIFPRSDNAADVANALMRYATQGGCEIRYHEPAQDIVLKGSSGHREICGVRTPRGLYRASAVIMATGGRSYSSLGTTGDGYEILRRSGHTITPLHPALAAFVSDAPRCRALEGLSLPDVILSLRGDGGRDLFSERGEIIFTSSGISGPAALNLSRHAAGRIETMRRPELVLDLIPGVSAEEVERRIDEGCGRSPRRHLVNYLKEFLPSRLAVDILSARGGPDAAKKLGTLSCAERRTLTRRLKAHLFPCRGIRGFSHAMTTRGGVPQEEIDPRTMESRLVAGLYITGELLDMDGPTGGYNLQAAFSTGWLAGDSIPA